MPRTALRSTWSLCSAATAVILCLAFAPYPTQTVDDRAMTSDEAITALMAGNQRYVAGNSTASNTPQARDALAAGQAPFAAVIRCADSRVAPEIVFDQSLGKLFVCGVAGNIPTPELIASLEYTVAVLGSKLIVVMGHSSCGAVEAAIKHQKDTSMLPGSLPRLIDQIAIPCAVGVEPGDSEGLSKAIACNANLGIQELMKRSKVIAQAVHGGDLKIIAGVQDLKTGRFTITKQ